MIKKQLVINNISINRENELLMSVEVYIFSYCIMEISSTALTRVKALVRLKSVTAYRDIKNRGKRFVTLYIERLTKY